MSNRITSPLTLSSTYSTPWYYRKCADELMTCRRCRELKTAEQGRTDDKEVPNTADFIA